MRWKNATWQVVWACALGSLLSSPTAGSSQSAAVTASATTAMVYMMTLLVMQVVWGSWYERRRTALETWAQLGVLSVWVLAQHCALHNKQDSFWEGLFHMLQVPFLDLPFQSSLLALCSLGPMYVWMDLQTASSQFTSAGLVFRYIGYVLGWSYGLGVMHTLVLRNISIQGSQAQPAGQSMTGKLVAQVRRIPAHLEGWLCSIGQALSPQDRELCTAILLGAPLFSCIMGRFKRAYQDPGLDSNVNEMFVAMICAYVLGSLHLGSVTSSLSHRLQVSQELLCDLLPSHVVRSLLDSHTPSLTGHNSHSHLEELGSGGLDDTLASGPRCSSPGTRKISAFGTLDVSHAESTLGECHSPSTSSCHGWQSRRQSSLGGGRRNRSLCSPLGAGSSSSAYVPATSPRLSRRKTFVLTHDGLPPSLSVSTCQDVDSRCSTPAGPSRLQGFKSTPQINQQAGQDVTGQEVRHASTSLGSKSYDDSLAGANQSVDRSSAASAAGEVIKAFQTYTDKDVTPLNIWTAPNFHFGDSHGGVPINAAALGVSSVQGTLDTAAARFSAQRSHVISEPHLDASDNTMNLEEALLGSNLQRRMIQSLNESTRGCKGPARPRASITGAEDDNSVDTSEAGFAVYFKNAARRISNDVTQLVSTNLKRMQQTLMDSIESLPEEELHHHGFADCHMHSEPAATGADYPHETWSQPRIQGRRVPSIESPAVSPRTYLLSGRKPGSYSASPGIADAQECRGSASASGVTLAEPAHGKGRKSGSFSFLDSPSRARGTTPRGTASSIDNLSVAEWHDNISIIFADVVGFTAMAQQVHPQLVMRMLNDMYVRFDDICLASDDRVYKVETIGDCFMAATGISKPDADHAKTALEFAMALREAAAQVQLPTTSQPVRIRIGIHSGKAMSGIVGKLRRRYCLFGDTVNTASRMESMGAPGCIHISNDTYLHVQHMTDLFQFKCRGTCCVKGKGFMTTWWVDLPDAEHVGPAEQPYVPKSKSATALERLVKTEDSPQRRNSDGEQSSFESLVSDQWWAGIGHRSGLIVAEKVSNDGNTSDQHTHQGHTIKTDVFSMSSLYSSSSSRGSQTKLHVVNDRASSARPPTTAGSTLPGGCMDVTRL